MSNMVFFLDQGRAVPRRDAQAHSRPGRPSIAARGAGLRRGEPPPVDGAELGSRRVAAFVTGKLRRVDPLARNR
jgi:hypothetical protein